MGRRLGASPRVARVPRHRHDEQRVRRDARPARRVGHPRRGARQRRRARRGHRRPRVGRPRERVRRRPRGGRRHGGGCARGRPGRLLDRGLRRSGRRHDLRPWPRRRARGRRRRDRPRRAGAPRADGPGREPDPRHRRPRRHHRPVAGLPGGGSRRAVRSRVGHPRRRAASGVVGRPPGQRAGASGLASGGPDGRGRGGPHLGGRVVRLRRARCGGRGGPRAARRGHVRLLGADRRRPPRRSTNPSRSGRDGHAGAVGPSALRSSGSPLGGRGTSAGRAARAACPCRPRRAAR